jgi:D-alanine-D-alanine ligase
MSFSHKIRVGVLRGGPSLEYEVSLNTGRTILANLPDEYEPLDIFISKDGAWHTSGLQKNPYDILKTIDVVVNALHGSYGEDGKVQKFLENFGIPYTGSSSVASALGMNKEMSKNVFKQNNLKTPHHILISASDGNNDVTDEMVKRINQNFSLPIIIKPINSGSSLGVSFVDKVGEIKSALRKSFEHSSRLLVEEYIDGLEATCGVIENFRGKDIYTLLPVEIERGNINGEKYFHSYNSKYSNFKSKYKVPGSFKEEEKIKIQEVATLIHQSLGLRHYSRSDFIIHPKRGLFALEVNTLPELTHHSSFIKSLEAVGGDIKEFLSHLISQTLKR